MGVGESSVSELGILAGVCTSAIRGDLSEKTTSSPSSVLLMEDAAIAKQ